MKGQIWVSVLLYFLIMAVVVALLLGTGKPIVERMRDRSAFYEMRDTFFAIDKQIEAVASEGPGSQRVIPIDVRRGKLIIEGDKLTWEMETSANLIDAGSRQQLGNLIISSDIDVIITETDDHVVMENTYLKANLTTYGNASSLTTIDISQILNWITYKGSDEQIAGTFDFVIAADATTQSGTGWTEIKPAGNSTDVALGKVIAHMQTTNYDFDLVFALESKADYLTITVENLEPN
ncbi:MAG: hypothetical protein ABIH34_02725 [Nanoarchaeota archaeon]